MGLTQPTERELALARALRRQAIIAIKDSDKTDVASKLDLKPQGVDALIWRLQWDLELAFRVTDLLGLPLQEILTEEFSTPPAAYSDTH